jgi:hypothetical protein
MKNLLLISFLCLLAVSASAIDLVTLTVAVTNAAGTTNGQTLTVNGDTRTFTNLVQVPGSQVLTNATAGNSASNLFAQLSTYPFSGLALAHAGTNGIALQAAAGAAISATLSPGWGTVVLTTNTLTPAVPVMIPYTTMSAVQQTNVASGVVALVAANQNTNVFYETTPAFTNLVGRTNDQAISGVKTLSGANTYSNAAQRYIGGVISNVTIYSPSITNFTLLPGTNIVSDFSKIFNDDAEEFNFLSNANDKNSKTIVRFGDFNSDFYFDPSLPLLAIQMTKTNYNFTNFLAKEFTTYGRTINNGDISFARFSLSSLAAGANAAVPVGTNVVCDLSGPAGSFTINGIAGGRDGKFVILVNRTGFTMTIAYDSGVDPTAANRIYTLSGSDKTQTGNSSAMLWYNSNSARWICIYLGQ